MASLGPLKSKDREELTPAELDDVRANRCPDCKGYGFFAGPSGGGSQNFKCAGAHCGSRFNDLGIGIVERISDPSPDAPKKDEAPKGPRTRFDREDPI